MSSRSGGGKIRNLRKVKSGYDQEFTLPKGTSAAPIKQVSVKNTYTNPKPVKHITEVQRVKAQILRDKTNPKTEIIKGKVIGKVRQNWGEWKPVHQKVKQPWNLTLKELQKKSIIGNKVKIKKWKKYIRGE